MHGRWELLAKERLDTEKKKNLWPMKLLLKHETKTKLSQVFHTYLIITAEYS